MEHTLKTGERIRIESVAEIEAHLRRVAQAIDNYEELDSDLESAEYVARGNGFCDAKYSEDFVEGQLAKLRSQKAELEELKALWPLRHPNG